MKKVLSFVLILALVLGSFSFAFGLSDIEGSANSEAIAVANDLGIVKGFPDGTFKPEQAVNRAEFAAMITRALAIPDSALAAYTSTSFKDTSGYGWAIPYLAFCQSKGIMIGDGMGNVMPGRTISVNEAITMAARAIGYTENSAKLVGNWPANYVTLGQTLGLYDDVAADTMISRESAAQVIYNSIKVETVTVNADGQTNGTGETMLTANLGATVATTPSVIDNTTATLINLSKYVGAYGKTYVKDDKVVAVAEIESTFLTVDDYDTNDNYFKTADGTKYYFASKYDTNTTNGALFVNGWASGAAINDYDKANITEGATYAFDVSAKTVNKAYSKVEWTPTAGFLFEADMLDEDDEINTYSLPMTDNDEIDFTQVQLVGVASLKDIKEDDVVLVYQFGGETTRVTVGNKTVTGIVSQANVANTEFTIDGVVYEKSASSDGDTTDLAVGNTGTAHLDYSGDIFEFVMEDSAAGNYALVIGSKTSTDYGTSTKYLKFFTKDGEEKEYPLTTTLGLPSGIAVTTASVGDDNFQGIVKFSVNSSGKVNSLTALATTAATSLNGAKVSSTGDMIGTTPVRSDVVIFANDSSDYVIATSLAKGENVGGSANLFAYTKDGKIAALFVPSGEYNNLLGGDESFGVINSKVNMYNTTEDDNYLYINGLKDGAAFSAFTDKTWANQSAYSVSTTSSGLVKFNVNASGYIEVVTEGAFTTGDINTSTGALAITQTDGSMIGTVGNNFYAIAPNAAMYVWDTDKYVVKTAVSALKNKTVKLYQSDDDVAGYDIVLAW